MKKKPSPPPWHETLERLRTTRQLLAAVVEAFRAGQEPSDLPNARILFEQLETLRDTVLHTRPEIAAFAEDVEAFARHVLGELLTARMRRLQ